MRAPAPLLAAVSLVVSAVVFGVLRIVAWDIEFGSPGAVALGGVFASVAVAAAIGGIAAYRRSSSWGWRIPSIIAAVVGFSVAFLSVFQFWLVQPN